MLIILVELSQTGMFNLIFTHNDKFAMVIFNTYAVGY